MTDTHPHHPGVRNGWIVSLGHKLDQKGEDTKFPLKVQKIQRYHATCLFIPLKDETFESWVLILKITCEAHKGLHEALEYKVILHSGG